MSTKDSQTPSAEFTETLKTFSIMKTAANEIADNIIVLRTTFIERGFSEEEARRLAVAIFENVMRTQQ